MAKMAIHKKDTTMLCVFLGLVLMLTFTITGILIQNNIGAPVSRIVWNNNNSNNPQCHSVSDSDSLGTHSYTFFTYDRDDAIPVSPSYLLDQAKQILLGAKNNSGGNEFVQISEAGAKTKHYGVSMFHQLHCLESLRFSSASHIKTHHYYNISADDELAREEEEKDHLDHCFQYLLQGIMCAADDTIEPSFVSEMTLEPKVRVINGQGVMHQCRDYRSVYKSMIESQTHPIVMKRELRDGDTVRGVSSVQS